ncbi:MAG: rRNA maturation RNase YbeY [Sphingorhabdus sp.]
MIETEISVESIWNDKGDWQGISDKSVAAAITAAPYARLTETSAQIAVSILFADNDKVQALNRDYRKQDRPTNILSFPMLPKDLLHNIANTDDGEVLLGDMILAYETCAGEAAETGISLEQHVTHLIVHGMLHLLGYDHIVEAEAEAMETLEIKALASMGLPNPYRELP